MNNENTLRINAHDGSITLRNYPIVLKKGTPIEEIGRILTPLYRSNIDYKNGTEWLFYENITFAESPCTLGLYIDHGVLTQAKINIEPLDMHRTYSGWNTNEGIDKAVLLALIEYKILLNRPFTEGKESFDWGQVWCLPDYKHSEMNSGIKYK